MPRRLLRLAPSHSHSPPIDEASLARFRAKLRLRALDAHVGRPGPHAVACPYCTATALVVHLLSGLEAFTPLHFVTHCAKRTSTTAPSPARGRRAVVLRRPRFPHEVGWSRAYPLLQPFPSFRVHSSNPASLFSIPSIAICRPASNSSQIQKGPVPFGCPGLLA